MKDIDAKKIKELPKPFDKPDLVIFESYYYLDDLKIASECIKAKIPYVIVPRSAFTVNAQKKGQMKKIIANILGFKKMAKFATAIQYLTEKEKVESGKHWNQNSFVIPNGIIETEWKKIEFSHNAINAIYIGRFDPFQKGQDLLIDACWQMKSELSANNFTISLYGPEGERHQYRKQLMETIAKKGLEDIILIKDGVFGKEKVNVLQVADLFLMTSRFEGMPMSLIEAMSYGLPCAITEGTNMAEEVKAIDAGWTCDTSVEGIIAMLKQIIHDSQSLLEKSKNAKKLSRKYNWDSIAKDTHELYRQLI